MLCSSCRKRKQKLSKRMLSDENDVQGKQGGRRNGFEEMKLITAKINALSYRFWRILARLASHQLGGRLLDEPIKKSGSTRTLLQLKTAHPRQNQRRGNWSNRNDAASIWETETRIISPAIKRVKYSIKNYLLTFGKRHLIALTLNLSIASNRPNV